MGPALAAYSWEVGGSKQVVYLDAMGHVHELYVTLGGTWADADLTSRAGAQPAVPLQPNGVGTGLSAYSWEVGPSKQVVYGDNAGHVHGGSWAHADLTEIAPGAIGGGWPLVGYQWKAGCSKQVVYFEPFNNSVSELRVQPGGQWQYADLGVMIGVAASIRSPISAYSWYTGGSKQVIFLTDDGDVHEFYV